MGGFCGGGSGSVGAANTPDNDTGGSGNSLKETLANIFTLNDGASYVGGQLVDDKTGQRITSGGTSSAGKVISGSANNESNDMQGPMPAGINFAGSSVRPIGVLPSSNRDNRTFTLDQQSKFTQKNTPKEDLANALTLFDGAKFVGGHLLDERTGESLTGGGYATNKLTGRPDRIYGVADDFSNNAPLEQGGMSDEDYTLALQKFKIRQSQLQNIAPSDAEYFGSFAAGLVLPPIGGYVADKMLGGGINARRANMDQHQAALDGGATPEMSEDGNTYLGYNKNGTFIPYIEEPTAPVVNTGQSDGNNSQDPLLDPSLGGLGSGVYDPYSATDDNDEGKVVIPQVDVEPIPANKNLDENAILYAGPMYEYWQDNFLPELVRSMPNITIDQIDESFRIYRDRQKRLASPRPSPKTIY